MLAFGLTFFAATLFLNLLITQFPGSPSRHPRLWFIAVACWTVCIVACLLVATKAFGLITLLIGVPIGGALLYGFKVSRRAIEARHNEHNRAQINNQTSAKAKP